MQENLGKKKTIMGRNSSRKYPDFVKISDHDIYDQREIAGPFNAYFGGIANTLVSNIQQPVIPFESHPPERTQPSIFFTATIYAEVQAIIKSLKPTAAGFDDVDVRIIKEWSEEIPPFLVHNINGSFTVGCFPNQLKIVRVVPVYKNGVKTTY